MTHEGDASKKHNRTISIVAGPNGAGKSTFVENYLPIVDDAWVLNGAVTPPEVVWRRSEGNECVGNVGIWHLIQRFERDNL